MKLIVQKFGGSSVKDAAHIKNVAGIIAETYLQGNDVIVVLSAQGDTTDDLIEKAGLVSLNIKKMSKMVITSVNGAAAGAGANLALSGDFVVAADNAKFIQAFINLGLVPDTGGTYLLSKTIGPQRAMELCATGRPLGAEEAKAWGLVYQVCPKEELEEQTMKLAKKLTAGPLIAYGALKKQFFEANYADYGRYLAEGEVPTQSVCISSNDFKENTFNNFSIKLSSEFKKN
jgi:enoyl-CoA hydratase/carnithine racemase